MSTPTPHCPRAFVAWSTGKDSAFALHEARRTGLAEIAGVLTAVREEDGRVAVHGVRDDLLRRQVAALGLPAIEVRLPTPCPDAVYAARMASACATIRAGGVEHVIFGDLFLADLRAWREARLAEAGMTGLFPLWGRETGTLARAMLAAGIEARLATVDTRVLPAAFAGRPFDAALLAALPPAVDPCGENGEFHTAVTAGPMFSEPIAVRVGAVTQRGGYAEADIVPVQAPSRPIAAIRRA